MVKSVKRFGGGLVVALLLLVLQATPAAAAAPGAPTGATAQAGNASATVSWQAPASNGGAAITDYTVTSTPGTITKTVNGSTLSAVVTGLTNGTSYTFTVRATNADGSGPASSPTAPVTPAAPPSAPRSPTAVPGNSQVTVSWQAPTSTGGAAITSYRVTAAPGGASATVDGSTLSVTVTGLTNGTSYTFTVAASNAAGASPASSPTAPVTPTGAPTAPTGVTATPGDTTALVKWSPPANNGGSAITSYTVTSSPGGRTATVNGSTLQATVTGLTNGTSYTFTVKATTAKGTGVASPASNAVTPFGLPGAPANVTATAGDKSAAVKWSAPHNGGSAITSYTVTSSPGGRTATVSGSTLQATVTGLTNGTSYTFTVRATNARGAGPASGASNAARPAAVNEIERMAGASRIGTAIRVSEDAWAAVGSTAGTRRVAQAVVLARSDAFADALAGTPLAVRKIGPLLLTTPEALHPAVRAEIHRVLPSGSTVHLLGGTAALASDVASLLRSDGYRVERFAGGDRFATAVEIARGLGHPATQFLVTGLDFPDALAAGTAAARVGGSLLLTDGDRMPSSTSLYLRDHPGTRYTVGGQAAAAYRSGQPVVGADRYETAVRVAERFFDGATHVGVASGLGYADALAGGAHVALRNGPLLLTGDDLPDSTSDYLRDRRDAVSVVYVYGGTSAVSERVVGDVRAAMT